MVSGIIWEPLPRVWFNPVSLASFNREMSKGPMKRYILRRIQERAGDMDMESCNKGSRQGMPLPLTFIGD